MRESRPYGSVRGALSNERPYRVCTIFAATREFESGQGCPSAMGKAGVKRAIPWEGGWYKLKRWSRVRRQQLRKEPLCAMCFERGLITAATVADHVVPHRGDWNLFWTGKLQSLCAACHNGEKQSWDRSSAHGTVYGPDGWPIQPPKSAE